MDNHSLQKIHSRCPEAPLSPHAESIASKISSMIKGEMIRIIPFSAKFGDESTAIAFPCTDGCGGPFEIHEPFEGYLEEFDGHCLKIRTDNHYCLKLDVAVLKDVLSS